MPRRSASLLDIPIGEKPLCGCRAIAGYYLGDPEKWRTILHLCNKGRLPHWRDGVGYRASPAVLDRYREAQQLAALNGRNFRPLDIFAAGAASPAE